MEVAVKQKGSEDVTVLLFEGENGPQVFVMKKNQVDHLVWKSKLI